MSRIGKQPITLPKGVEVTRNNGAIQVKGPKGTLERDLPQKMQVVVEDGTIRVERGGDTQEERALHGLTRTLIANMVEGVTNGYSKTLDIVGVGYRAELQGKNVRIQVGHSHPVEIQPRPGISLEVGQETNTRQFFIRVNGIDKETVGQQAAEIRGIKKPEPYKGKGIRYRGEPVRKKQGKSAKGAKGR
jgi:large subunit ribosomal protein L6